MKHLTATVTAMRWKSVPVPNSTLPIHKTVDGPDVGLRPRCEPPWVSWRLGGLDLRGDDGLALTMVVEAVDPPEQVPLRGPMADDWEAKLATSGDRADAGQLTPEPSRWRCMTAGRVRQPGPPSAPTTGARTRLAAVGRWRRGAAAGSTNPPTRRWPARPARGSARGLAGG